MNEEEAIEMHKELKKYKENISKFQSQFKNYSNWK